MAVTHLAEIKTFPQLVRYLRDELDWPIASEDFEEIAYEYTAEELGLDARSAARIEQIKRLRPLDASQPWGIFFVKFEPKQLPVVALRRILGSFVVKKRASANRSDRAAWGTEDLLFISSYGQGADRQLSFAHFSEDPAKKDLPTLRVLGWDELDTPLHLQDVAGALREHLSWPDDDADVDSWRQNWRAAFRLEHREVITTSKTLAVRLAELARSIRDRIRAAMEIETERGPLTKLMKAFQEALVHDLDADGFADMYAQTIAYGLLSARVAHPSADTADGILSHLPVTNPFLKELMETFLRVGGRRKGIGIDFDELGVSEVVALLDRANMEAVLVDFGDRNPQEDPVIHFYELFLKEYDAKKRMQRGVFYTPRPVVAFIVRSVHEILRNDFGLEDGLADTATWADVLKRDTGLALPKNVELTDRFVTILDPATGTGTFLVEVIDVIHKTMTGKWKGEGRSEAEILGLWNDYVPTHLLPRLHGYELLMAPYAIAHMKIGLKLHETGYQFGNSERAQVYLTNSLEPAQDLSGRFESMIPALAHESRAVNDVKTRTQFTVLVGNPPYSGISANMGDWIKNLLRGSGPAGGTSSYYHVDGEPLGEKKLWLQDDYVKFIRFVHWQLERSTYGVIGLITNHAFLDNPTFRGMRHALLSTFSKVHIVDLHGSAKKHEVAPDGSQDENVFDIQQGVAISLLTKEQSKGSPLYSELWGPREKKYMDLMNRDFSTPVALSPSRPYYLFVPRDESLRAEYESGIPIDEIFSEGVSGIVTARDHFAIDLDKERLLGRIRDLRSARLSDSVIRERFFKKKGSSKYAPGDSRGWKLPDVRAKVKADRQWGARAEKCAYRAFDQRWIYYAPWIVDWPRPEIMPNFLRGPNIGLVCTKRHSVEEPWSLIFVTSDLTESSFISNRTGEINYVFPLYLYPGDGDNRLIDEKRPNLKTRAATLAMLEPRFL
jgi:predicted helicase